MIQILPTTTDRNKAGDSCVSSASNCWNFLTVDSTSILSTVKLKTRNVLIDSNYKAASKTQRPSRCRSCAACCLRQLANYNKKINLAMQA